MPRLELPPETAKREPRIFELRVYETPSELGQSRKIEMFGPKLGELAIFRRVGLRPVLFASSVVGPRQPSFSYMLASRIWRRATPPGSASARIPSGRS